MAFLVLLRLLFVLVAFLVPRVGSYLLVEPCRQVVCLGVVMFRHLFSVGMGCVVVDEVLVVVIVSLLPLLAALVALG